MNTNQTRVVSTHSHNTAENAGEVYVLAFDTSNETIALGLGQLNRSSKSVSLVDQRSVLAHRASNTQLLPQIDAMLSENKVAREQLACVVVGRGPGSFTGVRIAMATAKGMASALEVGLIGVSTLDAVAWNAQAAGVRGSVAVVADAMRKEVYPVRYTLSDQGIKRLEADSVIKAEVAAKHLSDTLVDGRVLLGEANADGDLPSEEASLSVPNAREERVGLGEKGASSDEAGAIKECTDSCEVEANEDVDQGNCLQIIGDGLVKYEELFASVGQLLSPELWTPKGKGLLLCLQELWHAGEVDPFDAIRHNPAFALPVYTRLSDAEENERIRLAKNDPKNLATGVQEVNLRKDQRATADDVTIRNAQAAALGVRYKPLDAAHTAEVAALEKRIMGSDAWNEALVADELPRSDRSWWAAYSDTLLVGYAGGWIVDGQVQILKIGTHPEWRGKGIARELLARVSSDARDLGASTCSLEVRTSNAGAQAFYLRMGLESIGVRPRYYSDGEDACIMQGPLPMLDHDVAGMVLQVDNAKNSHAQEQLDQAELSQGEHPLILAIESSCDETAAALVDGTETLVSDVVASQIDFHARFGGVVPEIASRKHIEAICGVCDECLDRAAKHLGHRRVRWSDLDAVAVTYAPGLVGALVVGVAFAKAAAWAVQVPFIGVNHLEGHLYANKIGAPDFAPPAVVSLVSGGNTLLVHMRDWGQYEILGTTIDDAVGEAFDKVAKALGLGYPGGPAVSREALKGNPDAIPFPRAMMHSGDLRFSLSGLKTAVVTYINNEKQAGRELNIPDICASFQQAVVDVQVKKAGKALTQTGAKTFCLGGGVAANPVLRQAYEELCAKRQVRLILPPLSACGDNAGMIALVALDRYRQEKFFNLDADACAHTNLDEPY